MVCLLPIEVNKINVLVGGLDMLKITGWHPVMACVCRDKSILMILLNYSMQTV